MLRVNAKDYIQLGARIFHSRSRYGDDNFSDPSEEISKSAPRVLTENEITQVCVDLAAVRAVCNTINLPVSSGLLETSINDPPQSARELDILVQAVLSELKSKLFLFVPSHQATYYESDTILSDHAQKAFPTVYREIRSAGSCFAAGLNTACVFHAMRAAEIGVRELANQLAVRFVQPIELTEWGVIQDGIDAKIKEIKQQPRTAQRDEDQRFYSEAASQLRYFKDGWRVRVMHSRATYNESQAQEAIDHVRAFFEILAVRLKE
jgi:hypothetical protein